MKVCCVGDWVQMCVISSLLINIREPGVSAVMFVSHVGFWNCVLEELFQYQYPNQGHDGSKTYCIPGTLVWCVVGIPIPGWDDSLSQVTKHTHLQIRACFWELRENLWSLRKPKQIQVQSWGEHMKHTFTQTVISGSIGGNQELWGGSGTHCTIQQHCTLFIYFF